MARNWALVIGINNYNPLNFTPLTYAKNDAEKVRDFFQSLGFEVCCFTDDSPSLTLSSGQTIPTQPTYGNLVTFLQDRFSKPFLSTGDNCWFFFAGHGERHQNRDYLMPIDANSRGTEVIAGLTVHYIEERLSRCGADNIIMILDACRNEGSRGSLGIGSEIQKGLIKICSCQPTQKSWEIDELQQGVFTYALLEALRLPSEQSCATVERLNNYLKRRVPELCHRFGKVPSQIPGISVDPIEKQHFILLPQKARQSDLDLLKLDAFRLRRNNPTLAEQICIRLNALSMGRDLDVLDLLLEIRGEAESRKSMKTIESRNNISSRSSSGSAVSETLTGKADNQHLKTSKIGHSKIGEKSSDFVFSMHDSLVEDEYLFQDEQQFELEEDKDVLASERLGDTFYLNLRSHLVNQDWRSADLETTYRMFEVMQRQVEKCLTYDDLRKFPCLDLHTINQLWHKYSGGHFGFSVQREIWKSYCSQTEYVDWPGFATHIGWKSKGMLGFGSEWLPYAKLKFDLAAYQGHLPAIIVLHREAGYRIGLWGGSLMTRISQCGL